MIKKMPPKVQSLVFVLSLYLLVHNCDGQSRAVISTLYCQNMNLKVKNGEVSATTGSPTLYNVIISRRVPDKTNQVLKYKLMYALEAAATGKLVCMNSRGRVYSLNSKKYEVARLSRRRRSRSQPKARPPTTFSPPKNCLFYEVDFSSHATYGPAKGIYSSPHSNETSGLFLSFSPQGKVSGVRRDFDKLDLDPNENVWIKIKDLSVTNAQLNQYLEKTGFSKNERFNTRVRNCIRRDAWLFQNSTDTTSIRQKKTLKALIPKCKKKVGKRMNDGTKLKQQLDKVLINDVGVDGPKFAKGE